jgi:hypothetical protein
VSGNLFEGKCVWKTTLFKLNFICWFICEIKKTELSSPSDVGITRWNGLMNDKKEKTILIPNIKISDVNETEKKFTELRTCDKNKFMILTFCDSLSSIEQNDFQAFKFSMCWVHKKIRSSRSFHVEKSYKNVNSDFLWPSFIRHRSMMSFQQPQFQETSLFSVMNSFKLKII